MSLSAGHTGDGHLGSLAKRLVLENFGGWALSVLRPGRVFAAGGAIRAVVEAALSPGPSWRPPSSPPAVRTPKDLDLFVLDRAALEEVLSAAALAGCRLDATHDPMVCAEQEHPLLPVDIVFYNLGDAATPEVALTTFDFSVNAIGWDGERFLFPGGRREEILKDVAQRRTRVQPGHMFLRRPQRAARRLARLVELGYTVHPEDLEVYAKNFLPRGRP